MAAETTGAGYPLTFSPIELGGQRLRNRIIHASMTTRYARDGLVTDAYENYFVSRAEGGATDEVVFVGVGAAQGRSPAHVLQRVENLTVEPQHMRR